MVFQIEEICLSDGIQWRRRLSREPLPPSGSTFRTVFVFELRDMTNSP